MDKLTEKILHIHSNNGTQNTLIPGIFTFKNTNSEKAEPLLYEPSMVFITSGSKKVYISEKTYSYGKGKFLLVSIPTPFICEANVEKDKVFTGLTILFKKNELIDIIREMEFIEGKNKNLNLNDNILSLDINNNIYDAVFRLLDICMKEQEAKILGPLIRKEIMFYALQEHGAQNFCYNILNNSNINQLDTVIKDINTNYDKAISIERLAKKMSMSGATFYRQFKTYTGYSPIQYIKEIRLNKAKDLLSIYGLSVKETYNKVGYNSASQFCREYKKYFGHTPTTKINS